jgi:lysophospholipase L1-like esterase
MLSEKTNNNTYCYAKDDSNIVDIYSQLDSIPSDLNKKSTTIFLSVGGNDILKIFADKDVSIKDTKVLDPIFNAYKNLIKSIQTKMNKSKIILLDIYYPTNIKFAQYKPILEEWNKLITDFASTNNLQVINISNILTDSTDFTLNIEPSETGGEKIVDNILVY